MNAAKEPTCAVSANRENARSVIDVLLVEYNTLRAENSGRSTGRLQMLGLAITGAALVFAAHEGNPTLGTGLTALTVLLVVGVAWVWAYLLMVRAGRAIACIEDRVNRVAREHFGSGADLLKWERSTASGSRKVDRFDAWWLGLSDHERRCAICWKPLPPEGGPSDGQVC